MKKKCFFFDRDGVLNDENGYISKLKYFKIKKNTGKAIRLLNQNNYLVIIITNQAGIGRGLIKKKELNLLHNKLKKKVKKDGGIINDIFFCPYHPIYGVGKYKKNSYDRKPNPGMIKKAIKKWNIDATKSFMIGDKQKDKLASVNAGVRFRYKSKKIDLYKQIQIMLSKNS